VGLLVNRLADPADWVVGRPLPGEPFAGRRFAAAPPVCWPPAGPMRYEAAVARVLRRLRPARIEVHNRPEIARSLARRFPAADVALFLHNDPRAMRRARTATARASLLRRMQVVCVSETVRGWFLDGLAPAQVSGERVAVLLNCLALDELPPKLPAAERDGLILFAGRLVADKGADAFVAACASVLPNLPGWRAEMIGADRFAADSPETPFLAALRPRAAAAGVRLLGHLPHDRVLEAMARAAIVVVPSRWQEPFGMTALEAMGCGAALIVSPRPGLREVVGDAALLAEPEALAPALLRLARDPALRAALSARGLERAAGFSAPAARARLGALRAARAGKAGAVTAGAGTAQAATAGSPAPPP